MHVADNGSFDDALEMKYLLSWVRNSDGRTQDETDIGFEAPNDYIGQMDLSAGEERKMTHG